MIPDNEPEERLDCASSLPEVIGRSLPLHHPPRSLKFLVEWKDRTIPVVLDDVETVGMFWSFVNQCYILTPQESIFATSQCPHASVSVQDFCVGTFLLHRNRYM